MKNTNNNKKIEVKVMCNPNDVFNEENNTKEEVAEINGNETLNLDEMLEEIEEFAEETALYSHFAIVKKIYADEEARNGFSQVVANSYYAVEEYLDEYKGLSSCIYACLQIAEAPEDVFSDYLDRLKAIKNNLIKSKEMLAFMADEMEVELNV